MSSAKRNSIILATATILISILTGCASGSKLEINAVKEALSLYYIKNNRYPETIDALKGINEKSLDRFTYVSEYNYGSYYMWYHGGDFMDEFEPPPSQRTGYARAAQLANGIRSFYRDYGRFPENLSDVYPTDLLNGFAINESDYSVSEDQRVFTLGGYTFGPPAFKFNDLSKENRISILRKILEDFSIINKRYPTTLEELDNSGACFSGYVNELIQGKSIQYAVSEDGKRASLEGEELPPVLPHESFQR